MLAIFVTLAGLALGWAASVLMRTRYYHGVVINLLVGVAGALISGQLFAPILGRPAVLGNEFSPGTLAVAAAGSVLMLVLVELIRRAGTR